MEEGLLTSSLIVEEKADGHEGVATASDSSPITAALVLSILIASCATLGYGCASGYSSPAQSGIMKDLGLSIQEYSVFGSIMTIGTMLGATVSGKAADLLGRKGAMWLLETFCIMGWLAIIFAKDAWWLDFGRLSLGFGIGIHGFVVPVYIAEITPHNIRGRCSTASLFMVGFGVALMYIIGNIFTWRTLAVIGISLASFFYYFMSMMVFFLNHTMFGTSCWLILHSRVSKIFETVTKHLLECTIDECNHLQAKIGKEKELEVNLQRLRGKTADISKELSEIRDHTEMLQLLSESKFLDLFKWKYAHSLIVGVGLMLLVQFGGSSAIRYYASSIFESAGCSASVGTTAMAFIQIVFGILCVFLMDKFGRRPLLMVGAAGTCLGCILAGFAFLLKDFHQQQELTSIFMIAGILVYITFFSLGLGGIPWVIMSEIFPINIKGAAGSLVNLSTGFSSWIVTYAFNFLLEWSSAGVFFIFASISVLTIIFVAKLLPETKGKTLEEIQASMLHLPQ